MITVACSCNWDIPGVESLPSHSHAHKARVRWKDERNLELTIPYHDVALNLDQCDLLDEWKEIHIWVDWKKVARSLSSPTVVLGE